MRKKTRNTLIVIVAALVIGSCVFMFTISPVTIKKSNREMPEATNETKEITSGIVVEQKFINTTEDIKEIAIVFSRHYYIGEDSEGIDLTIEILSESNVLASKRIKCDDIEGSHRTFIKPDKVINGYVGKEMTLKIYTNSPGGTGLAIMMNKDSDELIMFGNENINGTLCFSIVGKE